MEAIEKGAFRSPSTKVANFTYLYGLVVWLRSGDPFESQNPKGVYASHFQGEFMGCAYAICLYGQI